jgi:hypothetical protein
LLPACASAGPALGQSFTLSTATPATPLAPVEAVIPSADRRDVLGRVERAFRAADLQVGEVNAEGGVLKSTGVMGSVFTVSAGSFSITSQPEYFYRAVLISVGPDSTRVVVSVIGRSHAITSAATVQASADVEMSECGPLPSRPSRQIVAMHDFCVGEVEKVKAVVRRIADALGASAAPVSR